MIVEEKLNYPKVFKVDREVVKFYAKDPKTVDPPKGLPYTINGHEFVVEPVTSGVYPTMLDQLEIISDYVILPKYFILSELGTGNPLKLKTEDSIYFEVKDPFIHLALFHIWNLSILGLTPAEYIAHVLYKDYKRLLEMSGIPDAMSEKDLAIFPFEVLAVCYDLGLIEFVPYEYLEKGDEIELDPLPKEVKVLDGWTGEWRTLDDLEFEVRDGYRYFNFWNWFERGYGFRWSIYVGDVALYEAGGGPLWCGKTLMYRCFRRRVKVSKLPIIVGDFVYDDPKVGPIIRDCARESSVWDFSIRLTENKYPKEQVMDIEIRMMTGLALLHAFGIVELQDYIDRKTVRKMYEYSSKLREFVRRECNFNPFRS